MNIKSVNFVLEPAQVPAGLNYEALRVHLAVDLPRLYGNHGMQPAASVRVVLRTVIGATLECAPLRRIELPGYGWQVQRVVAQGRRIEVWLEQPNYPPQLVAEYRLVFGNFFVVPVFKMLRHDSVTLWAFTLATDTIKASAAA